MRILQIIPFFHPAYSFGGPVQLAYDVSRELTQRGHEVMVYTSDANSFTNRLKVMAEDKNGIKIYRFRNLSMSLVKNSKLFLTLGLATRLKREIGNFDIIHLHGYRTYQNIVAHRYALKYKVPYVLQVHGNIPKAIFGRKGRKWLYEILFGYKILKNASKVIALTRIEAEQYRKIDISEDKIAIIPNGIDLLQYKKLPPKGSFKKKYGIEDNKKIVLYLARIHRHKGPDILVKSFALLKKNTNLKNIILVIVGLDDGFLSTVKSLITQFGLNDNVMITGPVSQKDKIAAYVDANIYVLPSRYEPFGISLLEAYACGVPVIASRIGGPSDLVVDGVTGIQFKPCNVKQLEYAIATLLNDNRAREMGLRAKRYVKENFSIEKVVDRLESLYDTVMSSKPY